MGHDTNVESLEERVARLEKQTADRQHRTLILTVILSSMAAFCVGFASDMIGRHVVQVRWPWLKGASRAVLFSTEDGKAAGLFLDSSVRKDRAHIVVDDRTGDAGLSLEPEGKGGIRLLAARDSRSRVSILDGQGKARLEAAIQSDGTPALSLKDKDGTVRASLSLDVDGHARLEFFDEEKRILFKAP